MKKRLLYALTVIYFITTNLTLQGQNWKWLNHVSHDLSIADYTIDGDRIIAIGLICPDIDANPDLISGNSMSAFCANSPINTGEGDSYVAVLDKDDGSVLSYFIIEDISLSTISSRSDNLIMAGTFSNTIEVEENSYSSNGDLDIIYISTDIQGNIISSATIGSSGIDYPLQIKYDQNGDIIMAANVYTNCTVDTFSLKRGSILAKVNMEGSYEWIMNFEPSFFNEFNGLEISSDGIYLLGRTYSELTLGEQVINDGGNSAYLLKVNHEGTFAWTKNTEIHFEQYDMHLSDDYIYFAGNYRDSLVIAGEFFALSDAPENYFIATYTQDGTLSEITYDENPEHYLTDIAVAANGDYWIMEAADGITVAMIDAVKHDIRLRKLDGDGNEVSTGIPYKLFDGFRHNALQLDDEENLYVSRQYYDQSIFNNNFNDSTYYNSFIGRIGDPTFITTEDFPPPSATSELYGGISIYPNPARNVVTLTGDIEHIKKGVIVNIHGQVVLYFDTQTIDISALPSGMYFLKIYSGETMEVKTFVIHQR